MRQAQRAGELGAVPGRDGNVLHHFPAPDVIDEFEFLGADDSLEKRFEPLLQRWLEDVVFVGIDRITSDPSNGSRAPTSMAIPPTAIRMRENCAFIISLRVCRRSHAITP